MLECMSLGLQVRRMPLPLKHVPVMTWFEQPKRR